MGFSLNLEAHIIWVFSLERSYLTCVFGFLYNIKEAVLFVFSLAKFGNIHIILFLIV